MKQSNAGGYSKMLIMVWEHNKMLCWKFRGTCWNSYWTKSKCRFRRVRSLSLVCRRISDNRRGQSSTYSKEHKFMARATIMYTLCNYKILQSSGYWQRKITSAVSHPTVAHNKEQWWCKYRAWKCPSHLCSHPKHFNEKATAYSKPGRELELPSYRHCSTHLN